jgi:hypothetical protein
MSLPIQVTPLHVYVARKSCLFLGASELRFRRGFRHTFGCNSRGQSRTTAERRAHIEEPPPWVNVDFDDVTEKVLKGTWEAQSSRTPFKFAISGRKPYHFSLRVLSQPNCEPLLIDRYAVSVSLDPRSSATDVRITSVELEFDGERKENNCLGMPSLLTFTFASSLHHEEAKVTVREQFGRGPDENAYEMTRTR